MSKPMSKKLVAAVLKRDSGLCVLQLEGCLGEASCADHRANRGMGGARSLDAMSQLVAACGLCNGRKTHVSGDERKRLEDRGIILLPDSTHDKTALRAIVTPVEYPDGKLYYLEDDGSREEIDKTPY